MKRVVAIVSVVVALLTAAAVLLIARERVRITQPAQVPAAWRDVRDSIGHQNHVGKVACEDCHDTGFEKPALDICTRCHATTERLHAGEAPPCIACHAFGGDAASTPWTCMSCHARDQGHVRAIGAHADEDCRECHEPHVYPGSLRRACTECHAGMQTQHAGLRGCRDCHAIHEATRFTLASIDPRRPPEGPAGLCARCHAREPGRLRVDERALITGHDTCTTCHEPHGRRDFAARACRDCHEAEPVLAAARHTCAGCHDPHEPSPARACTACHREQVAHPNPTKVLRGACIGCHPPHDRVLALASSRRDGSSGLACTSCHQLPSHATAQCLDCHTPHGGKPAAVGLCARCHAAQTTPAAGTGHAQCSTCHTSNLHGPQAPPPGCASCHQVQTQTVTKGHDDCARCHLPHAPRARATCASCHAKAATTGHGPRVACENCHRVHGPGGVAQPPACTSCHAQAKLAGLHRSRGHDGCARCHVAHEVRPSDDRATCTSSCHRDRVDHEPAAKRCAACHPFR